MKPKMHSQLPDPASRAVMFHSPATKAAVESLSDRLPVMNLEMVEAVGVEPTSETTFNRELSCFSTFIFVSSRALGTGEETRATSLIDLVRPAQTEQGRPAYCATIGTGP